MFNPNLALGTAAAYTIKERKKLDFQNSYRYVSFYFPQIKKKYVKKEKVIDACHNYAYTLSQWAGLLGDGFTAYNPEKLNDLFLAYKGKKSSKLCSYVCKLLKTSKPCNNETIEAYTVIMLARLKEYIFVSLHYWCSNAETTLTKLDKQYYEYVKGLYDAYNNKK